MIDKLVCRECRKLLPRHDALCSRWKMPKEKRAAREAAADMLDSLADFVEDVLDWE